MLRVIGQLQQGKSINWSTVHCGDKAKKTLSNTWVKVRAEIAALDPPVVEETAAIKTPRSRSWIASHTQRSLHDLGTKKRTAKTQTAADESDSSPSKKPKKTCENGHSHFQRYVLTFCQKYPLRHPRPNPRQGSLRRMLRRRSKTRTNEMASCCSWLWNSQTFGSAIFRDLRRLHK